MVTLCNPATRSNRPGTGTSRRDRGFGTYPGATGTMCCGIVAWLCCTDGTALWPRPPGAGPRAPGRRAPHGRLLPRNPPGGDLRPGGVISHPPSPRSGHASLETPMASAGGRSLSRQDRPRPPDRGARRSGPWPGISSHRPAGREGLGQDLAGAGGPRRGAGLPAVPGHRQGGAERPAGSAVDGLAAGHPLGCDLSAPRIVALLSRHAEGADDNATKPGVGGSGLRP